MDINNMVNNLTWKKMAAIALVIVTANWMIHEVIMWRYFNKFEQTVNRFNDQFVQDQQRIHNKIIESENDFNKWSKKFEQNQNEFSAVVDKGMKENLNFIQNSQQKMAEQQKAFDQKFSEMPDKMWASHQAFGKQAFDASVENGKQINKLRSNKK